MKKASRFPQSALWYQLTSLQKEVVVAIRNVGTCTRKQLRTRLALTPSSVSKLVSPLLAQGVLSSDPPGARRRNATLSNGSSLGSAIGIELGFERVQANVLDSNGKLLGPTKEYRPERRQPDAFLRCVQKVVRTFLAQSGAEDIMGIGIGYADRSAWNPASVFARDQPEVGGKPLLASLETAFELPVLSRCDAACAALGEARHGRLRQVENGLFLLYEDGIGLGIIAEGRVVFGAWSDAGEIGHIPLDDEGEYCQCGNIGCLETVAAKWALVGKAKQISDGGGHVNFRRNPNSNAPQLDELCAMAIAGDLLARNMLMKAGRALGRTLAMSASLLDPATIVLGGHLSSATTFEPMISALKESFDILTAHRSPQPIKIETSLLGRDATVIGAAELVFSNIFV